MTGRDIVKRALIRLGYTSSNGNEALTRRVMSRATETVNDIYADLWGTEHTEDFEPINNLDEEIQLSNKAAAVMIYGVAAFIALSEDDGDQNQLWITMYNRKKASLSKIINKQDVIPRSFDI